MNQNVQVILTKIGRSPVWWKTGKSWFRLRIPTRALAQVLVAQVLVARVLVAQALVAHTFVLSWKKLHVPLALNHMLSPLGGKKQPVPSNLF